MDVNKFKPRLGISTNDTGFDEEILAHAEDALNELAIYVGVPKLTDEDQALPSVWQFSLAYVIKMFRGDSMTQNAINDLNLRMQNASINFSVEYFNDHKQV